jgi:hypothetical protein
MAWIRMLRVLLSRIVGTFRRRTLDDEFDDEVRAHLEMLQARFIRGGMDPAEASYAARRQFGGVTQVKQDQRERRALPIIDVPPLEVVPAARAELQGLDRHVPMSRIRTGEDLSAEVIATARFLTTLMGAFAAIALVLTVVGLYGVLSYMVARRQREIGVRIALGAGRAAVIGMIWQRSAVMVTLGLVLGSAGALGAGRLLGSALLGVPVGIPLVVAAACAVIALTSSLATCIPAARAASVDPVQALRSE